MSEERAFHDLIRRVRAGDEEAAKELVRLYEPAIRREARVRLVDSRLRRVFEACGVFDKAQSLVEKSRARAEALADEVEPDSLRQLLYFLVDMVLAPETQEPAIAASQESHAVRFEGHDLDLLGFGRFARLHRGFEVA